MILYCLWTSPLVSLFYMQLTEEVNSISAIISLWSAPEVNLPPVQRKWCCILLFAQLPFPLIIFGPWDGGLYKCCFDCSPISYLNSFSTLSWMPPHSHGQFIQKGLFSRGYWYFCTIKYFWWGPVTWPCLKLNNLTIKAPVLGTVQVQWLVYQKITILSIFQKNQSRRVLCLWV